MAYEKMKKLGLLSLVTMCASSASVAHEYDGWCWNPTGYIGLGGQGRYINLPERFGQPLFRRVLPQAVIYGGIRFNDYLGVEAGYEYTLNRRQQRTLVTGQSFPGGTVITNVRDPDTGIPTSVPNFLTFDTKQYVDGINLGIMGYLPLICDSELFGSLGFSFIKIRATAYFVADNIPLPVTGDQIEQISRSWRKERFVPFVKVGFQKKITNCFDVRIFADWKNLQRFRIPDQQHPAMPSSAPIQYKNSFAYGVGFSYRW